MADDLDDLADEEFRLRLRRWLADVYPEGWRNPSLRLRGDDARWWIRTLHDGGWRAPAWPRDYGGLGLSVRKQIIYQDEMERYRVARVLDQGGRLVGPIIITYGTAAQKARYLRPILNGDELWSQGYSEPNAGSDLASLKTSAVRAGEHYILNGQKIWTTQAGEATHIYVLARTTQSAKKQDGITLFLLDMKTRGITIRPIRNLLGEEEFYQIFFDDVLVPAADVVGKPDQGWTVAKALLGTERLTQVSPMLARYAMGLCMEVARKLGLTNEPRYADRLARLACDLQDSASLYRDICEAAEQGAPPDIELSIGKLAAAELFQRAADCLVDLVAESGVEQPGGIPQQMHDEAHRIFMIARPVTIFGGTSEIQRNIIAKSIIRSR